MKNETHDNQVWNFIDLKQDSINFTDIIKFARGSTVQHGKTAGMKDFVGAEGAEQSQGSFELLASISIRPLYARHLGHCNISVDNQISKTRLRESV